MRDEPAVDYLIRIAKEHPGEITLICQGPLSNIAAALEKDPSFASNLKNVVIMGGTYLAQGNTDYFSSEFNFFKDPSGAAKVFDMIEDITMVPVETTFF